MADVDAPGFWEGLYVEGGDRWEIGRPAPPLVARLGAGDLAPGRAVVPGCGRGHEVLHLAELGWDVTGVDFAAPPIAAARDASARRGLGASFEQLDWFAAADRPGWAGAFDLVLEHTCFCAIDPGRRADYVDVVASLLRPGGRFVGLIWACGRDGGPPFHADPDETAALFGRHLVVDRAGPADASSVRAGEWLLEAHR